MSRRNKPPKAATLRAKYDVPASVRQAMTSTSQDVRMHDAGRPMEPPVPAFGGTEAGIQRVPNPGPSSIVSWADYQMHLGRHLVRTDGPSKQGIEVLTTSVISTGPTPRAAHPDLEDLWWEAEQTADMRGTMTVSQQLEHAYRHEQIDGDHFIRISDLGFDDDNDENGELTSPMSLETLEAEFLPRHKNATAANGNRVRGGIEINENGRPVAYWMRSEHPAEVALNPFAVTELQRVDENEICHLFRPASASAIRGISRLSTSVALQYDLKAYFKAETRRKLTTALYTGFIKKPDAESQLPGVTTTEPGGARGEIKMDPGGMVALPPGWDVTFSKPEDASGSAAPHIDRTCLMIAAAVGVPYELMYGDWSKSSDRTGVLNATYFGEYIEKERKRVERQALRKIWRAFVNAMVASGRWDPQGLDQALWYDVEWIWPRREGMRPKQDYEAAEKRIAIGVSNADDEMRKSGIDPLENTLNTLRGLARDKLVGVTRTDSKIQLDESSPFAQRMMTLESARIDRLLSRMEAADQRRDARSTNDPVKRQRPPQ